MSIEEPQKSQIALGIIKLFPSSIRETLLSDDIFLESFKNISEATVELSAENGVIFFRKELFNAFRNILKSPTEPIQLNDVNNCLWTMKFNDQKSESIQLLNEVHSVNLEIFWPFLSDIKIRTEIFTKKAKASLLAREIIESGIEKLSDTAVSDDEAMELLIELESGPNAFMKRVQRDLTHGCTFSSLVPTSQSYFQNLVGKFGTTSTLEEYLIQLRTHVGYLIETNPVEGIVQSLSISAHSSISLLIDSSDVDPRDVEHAFKIIADTGGIFSNVGAIEWGLANFEVFPQLEGYMTTMMNRVIGENGDYESRFNLLSSLITFVDGEILRNGTFLEPPPFWRRMASIAHASLLERCINNISGIRDEITNTILKIDSTFFFTQNYCDLRKEPKWLPDFIVSDRLQLEILGRIINAAQRYAPNYRTSENLISLLDAKKLINKIPRGTFPFMFFPGPLEGATEVLHELPSHLNMEIEKRLAAKELDAESFNILVGSCLMFKPNPNHGALVAKALRDAKWYIKQNGQVEKFRNIINGLSIVSAVLRSSELADELRTLMRRSNEIPALKIPMADMLRIVLICGGAHPELRRWCKFIGDWITELSFSNLTFEDAIVMDSEINRLCQAVPQLLSTVGSARAALNCVILR